MKLKDPYYLTVFSLLFPYVLWKLMNFKISKPYLPVLLRVFENRLLMYTVQAKFHVYAEVKYSCYCTNFYTTQTLSVARCGSILYQILPTLVNKYLRYRQKFISNLSKVWWTLSQFSWNLCAANSFLKNFVTKFNKYLVNSIITVPISQVDGQTHTISTHTHSLTYRTANRNPEKGPSSFI